jgi:hypothetical protein
MQSTIDEVLATEEARCAATRQGDLDALRRLLREDYTHVTGYGTVLSREQYVEWVKELPRRHERRDLTVRLLGDTAIVVGPLRNHLDPNGPEQRVIETMVTQVAVREGSAWRFVGFQITPVRSTIP